MTTAVEPASRTVERRGLRLHYLDWGNEEALPLLLLHSLGGAAGDWRRVADRFSPRYHVVALDQRGHGDSQHAADRAYATDDFVADIDALADALDFGRFIICGHSMGEHNTIAYAARHPQRLVCALVNDIPPAVRRDQQAGAAAFPGGRQPVYASIEDYVERGREQRPTVPAEMYRLLARSRLRRVADGYQPKADPHASITWAPADLWEEARSITRPVCFIRGGRSEVLDAETLQRMVLAIGPARSITLEQAGHYTFLEMEEEFIEGASRFFAAHGG